MANTKNYALRLQVIDPLLRKPGGVTLREMMDACNRRLEQLADSNGLPPQKVTSVNTIRGDIRTIEQTYGVAIVSERRGKPEYFWYADNAFSVYKLALSAEERTGLEKVLGVLGRLEGLPAFHWAAEMSAHLRASLCPNEVADAPIIQFDSDPAYRGTRWLNALYDAVLQRQVTLITYRDFNRTDNVLHLYSPWYLKQYRHRWYVFGHSNQQEGVTRLALDRIEKLSLNPLCHYHPNSDIDFRHYFDDIIGINHIDNGGAQEIVFRIPRYQALWLDSEPLHATQHRLSEDASTVTYALTVGINHEVIQMLLAYSEYVEVLAPDDLRAFFAAIHANALCKYEGCFDWDEEQASAESEA